MKIFLLYIFFFYNSVSYSQCITKSESSQIDHIILDYFDDNGNDWINRNNRINPPSEAFLLVLNVDSIGKIRNIYLLSDENNKDSAYSKLKNLTVKHFEQWQSKCFRNKLILLPIVLISENDIPPMHSKTSYVYDFLLSFTQEIERNNTLIKRVLTLDWEVKSSH